MEYQHTRLQGLKLLGKRLHLLLCVRHDAV